MSDLPFGWADASIGALVSLSKEKTDPLFSKAKTYIGLEHIGSKTRKLVGRGEADSVTSSKSVFRRDDILYGKLRPYLNKVWRSDCDGICSTDILVLRPEQGIQPGYIERFLTTPALVEHANNESTGINLPRVKYPALEGFPIGCPPASEQKRIVAKLESCESHITAARESLDEVPALLEQYRQSILAAAFRGDLTKDWRAANPNTEPASKLIKRLRKERRQRWEEAELAKFEEKGKKPPNNWKDKYPEPTEPELEALENLPPIPRGWSYQTLEAISDVSRPICYGVIKLGAETPGGVPCLRTSDVRHLRIDTSSVKRISPEIAGDYARTNLEGGEILINVRGTLGGVSPVPRSMKNWNISREVAMAPVLPQINSHFCALTIASIYAQQWLTGVVKGVAYSGINISDLKTLPIPVPPQEEQHEITQAFSDASGRMEVAILEVDESSETIQQLNDALLQKAFSGQLVPQDPDDEPASLLLERIQERRLLEEQIRANRPKKKRSSNPKMSKIIPSTIHEALKDENSRLSTSDLFERMGHANDSGSELVESFLIQLRDAIEDGTVSRTRENDEDYFSLKSA